MPVGITGIFITLDHSQHVCVTGEMKIAYLHEAMIMREIK